MKKRKVLDVNLNGVPLLMLAAILLGFMMACKHAPHPQAKTEHPAVTRQEEPKQATTLTPVKAVDIVKTRFLAQVNEGYRAKFKTDSAELPPIIQAALHINVQLYAEAVERFDQSAVVVVVEGYCDERGSDEYNMALGERRAIAVAEFYEGLGVSPDAIKIISHGESAPDCREKTPSCYARNRNAKTYIITPQED